MGNRQYQNALIVRPVLFEINGRVTDCHSPGRAANCPGFPGTIPDFELCPGGSGRGLKCPGFWGRFEKKITEKKVFKMPKIDMKQQIHTYNIFFWGLGGGGVYILYIL